MKAQCLIALTTLTMLTVSCVRKVYYVSPVYGSNTPYHTVPVKNEQTASALYGNASLQNASHNDWGADHTYQLQANLYRTHNLGLIQAYYGGGLTLGIYNVESFDTGLYPRNPSNVAIKPINDHAGNLFYGTGNVHGGMHLAIPFSTAANAPEWRLGAKMALHQEFGNYLSFRKSLNADSVNGVAKNSVAGNLSGYTELLIPSGGSLLGAQLEVSWMLGKQYSDVYFGKGMGGERYFFTNWTIHATQNRSTLYLQCTFGPRIMGLHAGINYRLATKSKKPR